ncbi:MAG: CoA-binding protein, partial [Candidatus Lokiarchaeota archaeon]|nr:CoA-binding protein [Candidatus Lokiarchaeota archaeon]
MFNDNLPEIKDISFLSEIQNIAIIGVSKSRNYFFLKAHQENFDGKIFAINPNLKKIPGFDDGTQGKIFNSIKDIPEPIDFAFIAVAKEQILKVIDDCVEKGVKLVSIFTSEFSDSGTEEGIQLEKELIKHAKKMKILGPNGMGLYYPKKGIAWRLGFPSIPGRIGLICQSGGLANLAIFMAKELGLTFSKVFSFGNGADLDFVDLLAYLSRDDETDYIIIYLEGIKEGRGKALRKVLEKNKKPIILLKGGV